MAAKATIPDISIEELFVIILDLSKKVNEIHQLHFSEKKLISRKNQKQKFLAEILTSPTKNSKGR